ncbi:hypothetical protein B4065_1275 [Caldibacillus thermoamylovorans]|nr:hypothetical protein B4065_1275 [Caldibacillus thermoamylovorans]
MLFQPKKVQHAFCRPSFFRNKHLRLLLLKRFQNRFTP